MKSFATIIWQTLVVLALISTTTARNVKFSVVSFGKKVSVQIGTSTYNLSKLNDYTPLYQSTINVNDNAISYKYIVDNVAESFTRTLAKGATTTHNEFYGRKDTIKEIPQLPSIGQWTRSLGKGELFDDSYIPTVHITGTKSETLFTTNGKPKSDYLERTVFILKDSVYSFQNAGCIPKNYGWNKFQFKLKLGSKGIENRTLLKFRDNNEDPTFMRQDLYGDILNALGYPTIQSVKVRVYVNNRAVGYYILQEEAASESFVRSAFHAQNGKLTITDFNQLGQSFDAGTGSDFYLKDENGQTNGFYDFKVTNEDRYDRSSLLKLAQQFDKLNTKNDNEVENFNKNWFDIDIFYKAVAMQYLTAHWDSYLFFSSNFALYTDPTQSKNNNYKFYFICQDWDGTFGLNVDEELMLYSDYINVSYKQYINKKWGMSGSSPYRYAYDKLLSTPKLQKRFEAILKDIVMNVFNPVVLGKRVDALAERHRDSVAWSYEASFVNPLRKGTNPKNQNKYWTINDFDKNIRSRSGHGAEYGLLEFVTLRCQYLKKEFGWDIPMSGNYVSKPTTTQPVKPTTTQPIKPTTPANNGKQISTNGQCGAENGNTVCPDNLCCSQYGWCDNTPDHCGAGCQSEFGRCNGVTTTIRTTTTIRKTITTTIATTTVSTGPTSVDQCGPENGNARCVNNLCCSKYGWCGSTGAYCGNGCQKGFGRCN